MTRPLAVIALLIAAACCRGQPIELPGTQPLTRNADFAAEMLDGIDRFLDRETDASVAARKALWHRDPSSAEAYAKSLEPNRQHLAKILGVVDAREPVDALEFLATTREPAVVGRGAGWEAYTVRWPVLKGVWGVGLLLKPTGEARADVVALPDADQTPEQLAGLVPGIAAESQFARRLAECGCRVLVPTLIDRSDTYSVTATAKTNQPHREFIYRQAYEMGRQVIGYEVQKVLAGVDFFARERGKGSTKIGVIGYGEGGMLALDAAALDTRIDAVCVSGYFRSRQQLWREPIERNVFGLLREFGDAEIASLVSPRAVVIEACAQPAVAGPPAPHDGRTGAARGRIETPDLKEVQAEVLRIGAPTGAKWQSPIHLVRSGEDGQGPCGSEEALNTFLGSLGVPSLAPAGAAPEHRRKDFNPQPRLKRQFEQLEDYTQALVRDSDRVRGEYWSKADGASHSPEKWRQSTEPYREQFATDVLGRFDRKRLEPNVRTRKIYDEPKFVGYEVLMDVFPDVTAYGILLVPKDLKPGERRPVVVCQHGLDGRPRDVADPKTDNHYYHRFACRLADEGFVTYAPQNPYLFGDRFRQVIRKAQPLGKTLWSFIVPQHEQATDWLASLPFVDPDRIAFYGLSYGGKTAMRVPAVVPRYCLSICSGDFNEWVWKNTSLTLPSSYMGTNEYDMPEWNLGNRFNYAEMAGLIAPRPFMVERGHRDGVGIDEWVAYEYAKVARRYTDLGIPERTTIEYFDGPHEIHGVGTFRFLHEQLRFP